MARTKRRKAVRRRRRGGSRTRLEHLALAVVAAKKSRCRIAQNHLAKARKADPSASHGSEFHEVAGKVRRLCG